MMGAKNRNSFFQMNDNSLISRQLNYADQEFTSMIVGKKRVPFSKEEMMILIKKTYHDFYGKFIDQFNPEEYQKCVDQMDMIQNFSPFLEYCEDNLLTTLSMPWIDLGDIPSTHSFMRTEHQQVFYNPQNMNPEHVHIFYSWFQPKYWAYNLKDLYDSSCLKEK